MSTLSDNDVYYPFPYTIHNVSQCYIDTETKLRSLVDRVMTDKHGIKWQKDALIGFLPEDVAEMEVRMEQERKANPYGYSDRLIDYSYLSHLEKVILKDSNWNYFAVFFPEKKKTELLFEMIIPLRNPIIHGREVTEQCKHLCLGICGEFLRFVTNWQLGFSRMVKTYQCDFGFEVSKSKTSEEEAREDARHWIDCIKNMVTTKLRGTFEESKDVDGNRLNTIKISKGKLEITVLDKIREQNMGNIYHRCYVILKSQSAKAIDAILELCPRRYWNLQLHLKDQLPVNTIISNAEAAGRRNYGSNTFTIDTFDNTTIRIFIYDSSIDLAYDSNNPNSGFLQAHNIFSIDLILAILYNRFGAATVRDLLLEALNPPKVDLPTVLEPTSESKLTEK